ncbi:CPBP family intramembrane glutamic endopeptidase [Gordonia sp. SL306]|uniref:CPBP family intramembrane glutamic endopeptidase n=1 Tax=Gordonia sp. SL306 TaxID=2995145 RepID=UPI00226D735C|nr:CPBP family intramembrane glutamic endopeptidase [Gordonia sp. SL306]WAC58164.1 CPBP family intramembrane metalloprotease [Gordonia sp. SL306]
MPLPDHPPRRPLRQLTYVWFAVVVLVYLAIIQLGGLAVEHASGVTEIVTTRGVVFSMIIPLGVALAFTFLVVTRLGWWRPVLYDERPVSRWVWIVPVLMLVAIAAGTDYRALADKDLIFVLTLLVATQFVGWGEETMFRGIGVTAMREHGLGEGRVALWSSIVFGAVHLTNAIGHGVSAIPQAIAVSLAGYFFYLMRRVSRGNVLNSVVHGLFDFSILTGTSILVDQSGYVGSVAAILVYPILAVILIVGRKRIEPAPADTPTP